MNFSRRHAIRNIVGATFCFSASPLLGASQKPAMAGDSPTNCDYAPPGEYIKDHTLVFQDGWWHLFSISGTQGYYHGYNGNEETFSWSVSKNLVEWEFRGHVMHSSQREGTFDQHEVWAPFCLKANNQFYMFYTGVIHPYRPMEYRRLGFKHPWVSKGHKEAQGLAISKDLTDWVKVGDPVKGLNIPGRDSNVVWDDTEKRWLLYSTGQGIETNGQNSDTVLVSCSKDLVHWEHIGICAIFPKLDINKEYGSTIESWNGFKNWAGTTESTTTMKHPVTGQWILMGNWQYVVSDNPVDFKNGEVRYFDNMLNDRVIDMGYACEMIEHNGKWFRSGTFGEVDHWRLGFTEIEWVEDGAFRIVKPSEINYL